MHDLKYPDELLLRVHPDRLVPIVQHGEGTIFADGITGFRDSMEQIRQLIWLPEFIVRSTANQIMFDVASMYEAIGEPLPRQLTPEQWKKVAAVKERKLQEESSITDRATIEARLQKDLADSMSHLRRICSLEEGNPQTLSAVECLLISLLLQTWTAFESLATDVWVASLNFGPKSLVKKASRIKIQNGREQQPKTIPIESLEKFNFDLTNSMGFLLKEKFDFTRLKNIKTAYVAVFGEKAKPIFDTNNLNPANNATHEALRNVFAHRGGRVDGQFRALVSKCPASDYYSLRNLQDNQRVEINAAMVRDLWLSACATATVIVIFAKTKLLSGVDDKT